MLRFSIPDDQNQYINKKGSSKQSTLYGERGKDRNYGLKML